MSDVNKSTFKVESHASPTDEQLSSLYRHSMGGVETESQSDELVLAQAQEKAQQLGASRRTRGVPFFGSESARSWSGVAALGVVVVCLWIVLQRPINPLQAPTGTAVERSFSQPSAELKVEGTSANADKLLILTDELSEVRHGPLSVDRQSDANISTVHAGDESTASQRVVSEGALSDMGYQDGREKERRSSQFTPNNSSAHVRLTKPIAGGADSVQEPKSARNATPVLGSEWKTMTGKAPRIHSSDTSMMGQAAMSHDRSVPLDREAAFNEAVSHLALLVESGQRAESLRWYEQLNEEYSGFEIPAELLEKLKALRQSTVPVEVKSDGTGSR